jgi:hypothetical protein
MAAGTPCVLSYGPVGNADLLRLYGFALPDNPHDRVDLWAPLVPSGVSCMCAVGRVHAPCVCMRMNMQMPRCLSCQHMPARPALACADHGACVCTFVWLTWTRLCVCVCVWYRALATAASASTGPGGHCARRAPCADPGHPAAAVAGGCRARAARPAHRHHGPSVCQSVCMRGRPPYPHTARPSGHADGRAHGARAPRRGDRGGRERHPARGSMC